MPISLPDSPVKDFPGINRNFDKLATSVNPASAAGTVGNAQLQDDAVDARVLADDAIVDVNRAVTRNHIRNQAIDGSKLDPAVPLVKRFAADVGDGATTSILVDHNLGSRDVLVQVYDNSAPRATIIEGGAVLTAIQRTTLNRVTLVFAAAPANNAYRVVVLA